LRCVLDLTWSLRLNTDWVKVTSWGLCCGQAFHPCDFSGLRAISQQVRSVLCPGFLLSSKFLELLVCLWRTQLLSHLVIITLSTKMSLCTSVPIFPKVRLFTVTGSRDGFSEHSNSKSPFDLQKCVERLYKQTQDWNKPTGAFTTAELLARSGHPPGLADDPEPWGRKRRPYPAQSSHGCPL
jgi:hypothetical protein